MTADSSRHSRDTPAPAHKPRRPSEVCRSASFPSSSPAAAAAAAATPPPDDAFHKPHHHHHHHHRPSSEVGYLLCVMAAGPVRMASRVMCPVTAGGGGGGGAGVPGGLFGHARRKRVGVLACMAVIALWVTIGIAFFMESSRALPSISAVQHLLAPGLSPAPGGGAREHYTEVTVLLDKRTFDYPFSLFYTGALTRFGSGAFHYNIVRFDSQSRGYRQNVVAQNVSAPCVVASAKLVFGRSWRDNYASQCAFLLTSDEFCAGAGKVGIDMRQYDGVNLDQSSEASDASEASETSPDSPPASPASPASPPSLPAARPPSRPAYVPLGPRLDFWAAFKKRRALDSFAITPSSQRKTVFNAIFSKSTSESRAQLSELLDKTNGTRYASRTVVRIADQWAAKLSGDHMGPELYTETLLDSVFTLSPIGHHPECYRLYEAIEAGSIPIVALDEDYRHHQCGDSLRLMRKSGAPLVFVASWEALPARMDELLADVAALDQRQEALQDWYAEFMRTHLRNFEAHLLERSRPVEAGR